MPEWECPSLLPLQGPTDKLYVPPIKLHRSHQAQSRLPGGTAETCCMEEWAASSSESRRQISSPLQEMKMPHN